MTSPFAEKSIPELIALVKGAAVCEECKGTGKNYAGADGRMLIHTGIACRPCLGTGKHSPLEDAEIDALAACVCEGMWVRLSEKKWFNKEGTFFIWEHCYFGWELWLRIPAYTTDPREAMRLMVKYHLDPTPILTGGNQENWKVHGTFRNESSQVKNTVEDLCRALTECALIEALTMREKGTKHG